MSRKGENIYKRKDGRWEARYEKGRTPDQRIIYGFLYGKTYREVKEKKRKILSEKNTVSQYPGSLNIRELSRQWLLSIRHTVKESTYSCYTTLIQKHIISYFGQYSFITSEHIHQFINDKITTGLSPASVRSIVILLERILRYGEEQRLFPSAKRTVLFPKNSSHIKDTLDTRQLTVLSRYLYLDHSSFAAGVLLCMYTGIRIGELCGLKGDDFDFANATFSIHRTVSRIRNVPAENECSSVQSEHRESKTRVVISTPKSVSSLRSIPIPDHLLSILEQQELPPEFYLLTGTEQCMEPRNVQRRFQRILEKCGLPTVTFHSLRHSFATLCIGNGVDSKALSEILGHSSVRITLDIYVHSNMEQKRAYINQLVNF